MSAADDDKRVILSDDAAIAGGEPDMPTADRDAQPPSDVVDAMAEDARDAHGGKKAAGGEAVEEVEATASLHEKENRLPLTRTESTWTNTTVTTLGSEADAQALAPRKRTWREKLDPAKQKHPPPVPEQRTPCPEWKAGFWSMVTFNWMGSLMNVGYQRPLELTDIWSVNPDRSVYLLQERLMENFGKRKDMGSKRPLVMAMYDTFRKEFLIGAACQLTSALVQVLAPFVLKYLIRYSTQAYEAKNPEYTGPRPHIGVGLGYVFGVTIMMMMQSLGTNHFMYHGMMVGGQVRAALIAVIFDKTTKISGRAKAGGKDAKEQTKDGAPPLPEGIQPGSKEEKKFFKKHLGKDKKKGPQADVAKGVSGDGQGWANGRIVNLMSVDTYRIDQAFGWFHMIWTAPIQVVVVLILLLINLSYSALSGFAFILICMPLLGRAVKSLMRRRRLINKITDQRVSLTQEILSSVRFVKFFGWETSFLDRLADIRKREIDKIAFLLAIRNGIMAVSMSVPIFAAMLAFITYTLSDNVLDPAPVFSSLALFNALRLPLNLLPLVLGQVVDGVGSAARIQEFLLAEEVKDDAIWDPESKNGIKVERADFTWERTPTQNPDKDPVKALKDGKDGKESKKERSASQKQIKADEKNPTKSFVEEKLDSQEKLESPESSSSSGSGSSSLKEEEQEHPFEIKNIDFTLGRKELVAVIGSVGSGKSSLLAALAGDMRRTHGSVSFGGSRAFCPQYAWIQNATVKNNIVFGKEFNKRWYNQVVDACALRPDLDMLPAGDQTEIGEKGITVSGGQKQRLNIARAIYFDADIVLMDDPLSAVDAHVGRHIMDNAICGLLRDKARVLATHQLHVLHRVDRIIWMKEGTIHKIATFDDMMANDEEFQRLMLTTASEEKKQSEEEVNEDEIEGEKKEIKKKKKKPAAALMQSEERAVSSVGWSVYVAYIRATGSVMVAPGIFILLVLSQGSNILTSLWLSWWTSGRWGSSDGRLGFYIGIYAMFGVVQAALNFIFSASLTVAGTHASRVMLHRAITRVLRAPMSFFDTTPLGRITNRFSKDIDTMDNALSDSIRMFTMTLGMVISVFALIISYYYYFVIALVPLYCLFLYAAAYYRSSAREIKRHEAVLRSHVFSRFGEAVSGISTIRAYRLETQFANSVRDAIDTMNGAYMLTFANQRWLSIRLDLVGNLMVFTVGILVVTSRFSVNPSIGGLVLSYVLSIAQMLQFSVRQLAEVENNMNSTERVHFYGTELEEEAPLKLGDVRDSWPEKGEIVFDNVQMRYRDGLPLVLKGLTMHVKGGERIGVVGRTGAGKSSIMSTVFRLVELSGGSISIDGVNIATVGLHDLRSRLAIIPQDPTLFRGTIRSNLDPFNEHTDLELWDALRQADLVGADQDMGDGTGRVHLETVVEDEGLNFSLGQRQLLALARALVRGSQIIVCDEATSSVDFETDQKIQRTIVRGFHGKTLLCIAHRLKTIIGYDRILVMDAGNVAELDSPINLYDAGGIFRGMCDRSGIRRQDFFDSAEANFLARTESVQSAEGR